MATLAFQAAGSALGAGLLPGSFLGISGATVGSQLGHIAGGYIDQALFGTGGQNRTFEGPRLDDLRVTTSSEGAPIPRIYGAARIGGQVIWATDFEEVRTDGSGGGQGKGGATTGGGGSKSVTYQYYANFAVALAEGEITGIGRVWADGNEWDLSAVSHRVHFGSETQEPDTLITAMEGSACAPAYRGTSYIVFERLALAEFGNRLPQLSFEVFRAVDDLHEKVRGTVIIPGSGEFVYATTPVQRREIFGDMVAENVHTREAETDWSASMNQMHRALPSVGSASLITCWFGDDLRAASCQIQPGVERASKVTQPVSWQVAGVARDTAYVVSQLEGRPALGGTPSDASVIEAIGDLKARGIKPVLMPFLLMDVAEGNIRVDPYSGIAGQPAYPWRGRITVDPAPGVAGSPDKTAAAAAQVEAFIGNAAVSDFTVVDAEVVYSGPMQWSYRRFILHYAHLALAAGGVDTFVIGTEMRGLTWARDAVGSYPFVAALVQLAADVKAVLGPGTNVTYAADWSEYFGHQPADGTGDVAFHLDPLWACADIDAIGVDLYWPLSDWRDGGNHLDAAGARSIYDLDYLKSNLRGGEGFDWYYATPGDRKDQVRTPIADGAGKPWVFRYKDMVAWWQNPHFDRPGGIEQATPTAWVPQSKPVWLMEIGCPAIDKGANQPNVFFDPKSSESALPYFAKQRRDDFMQRAYLRALIEGLDPTDPGYVIGSNPQSAIYAGSMIDLARVHVYAWDARSSPAFPNDVETWGDAPNWAYGHWLNGRVASMPLADTITAMFADYGFGAIDVSELEGMLPGYVIDRVMSLREALQLIEMGFFIDTVESGEGIILRHRGRGLPVANLDVDQLVSDQPEAALLTVTRGQETELPAVAKITYASSSGDYRRAVAEARRLTGFSDRVATASLAMMLEPEQAQVITESWLHEAWAARRRATFSLPPSRLAIEAGDLIETMEEGTRLLHRVTEISDHGARAIEALGIDPAIYEPHETPGRTQDIPTPPVSGAAAALFLDLPLIVDGGSELDGYVALHQSPWPGQLALYQSAGEDSYALAATAEAATVVGTLVDPLPAGAVARFDYATRVRVELASGELGSVSRLALFDGANALAVRRDDDSWEVCQFEHATLVSARTYELSGWLRGQLGSESQQAIGVVAASAGQPVALIDASVVRVAVGESGVARPLNWRYGPSNRDIGHTSYVQDAHAFQGIARRPYAPVHLRGARDAAGNLSIHWVRRTRIGGDNWELTEVALGETMELYEVDILDGANVVRTLTTTEPEATYTASEQVADFGGLQASLLCRVHQLSATWGRGKSSDARI